MNPSERGPILRRDGLGFKPAVDAFAEEAHVSLTTEGGHRISVLATPSDLRDFALGFALAEGWWDGVGATPRVELGNDELGLTVHLTGAEQWGPVNESRLILPSCGGCGERLTSPPAGSSLAGGACVHHDTIAERLEGLRSQQALFQTTGGVHAAALLAADGTMLLAEDIGRHTAVDKVAGMWIHHHASAPPSVLLLSGRCGWDLMAKVVRLGLPQVACVGAMSNQAAKLARDHGVLVMGFALGDNPQFVGPWTDVVAKA